MASPARQILRWIAVLPGAIVCAAVAQVIAVIGGLFTPDWMAQAWSSWTVPVAFVIGGAYIAPKFKFVVALVLTIVVTGLTFLLAFLVLTNAIAPSNTNKWWFLVTSLIGIVGPIWACVSLHNEPESLFDET
jgi:hypothetical protein